MIDWITCVLPVFCRRALSLGETVFYDGDGVREFSSERKAFVKSERDGKCMVRFVPPPANFDPSFFFNAVPSNMELRFLRIELCPSKWFFGHNLVGSSDLVSLLPAVVFSVLNQLPPMVPFLDQSVISRVDLTRSYLFASDDDAVSFVSALQQSSSIGWRRASNFETTILWPGRAWSLKFYCKGAEIRSQRGYDENVARLATGVVRAELTLRGEALSSPRYIGSSFLYRPSAWSSASISDLHARYVSRVRFGDVSVFDLSALPRSSRSVFLAWQAGLPAVSVGSPRTIRRHRSLILSAGGPDITLPAPPPGAVLAFQRVLRPVPWTPPAELLACLQPPVARAA